MGFAEYSGFCYTGNPKRDLAFGAWGNFRLDPAPFPARCARNCRVALNNSYSLRSTSVI